MRWNACITLMRQLTIFNSLYFGFFVSVLHAFCRHLNIILIHFYWLSLLDSNLRFLLYCLAFCGDQLFEFYRNSYDWLPRSAVSECGKSQNRLLTVLYPFFFCLLVFYFYVAPSRVFFEYVSVRFFRWYLLILISLLTLV